MGVSLHGTFAELRPETYHKISEHLLTLLGTDNVAKCTLLDLGSGRGKMGIELAAILPLRAAIGVEIDENLHMFAQRNSLTAAHVYPEAGPCLFGRGDLFLLGGINGANIVVAFDRAFGDRLKDHICNLANNSKDTLVLVSCFSDLREKNGKGSMAMNAHTHCIQYMHCTAPSPLTPPTPSTPPHTSPNPATAPPAPALPPASPALPPALPPPQASCPVLPCPLPWHCHAATANAVLPFAGLEAIGAGSVEGVTAGAGEQHRLYFYHFHRRCVRAEWWQKKVLDRAAAINTSMTGEVLHDWFVGLLNGRRLMKKTSHSAVLEMLIACAPVFDYLRAAASRHVFSEWLDSSANRHRQ